MLEPGILCGLFLAGCWLYCLTDAALTPADDFAGWPKRRWVTVIAVTLIVGAAAWLVTRRARARARSWPPTAFGHLLPGRPGEENITWYPHSPLADRGESGPPRPPPRHPAGRSRLTGPADPAGLAGPAEHARPIGPDDDPEFLRQLARRIQGGPAE